MWELDCEEGWALKNLCFWTVVLEKTLESPWTARRSNQSILKEISPGISLEGMMLKWKLQYFGHLMRKVDSLEKTRCWEGLGAGGEGDDRGWDGWMASPTQWTWIWVNSGSWWWTGKPGVLRFMGHKESDTTEWLNWAERMTIWSTWQSHFWKCIFIDRSIDRLFDRIDISIEYLIDIYLLSINLIYYIYLISDEILNKLKTEKNKQCLFCVCLRSK